MKDNLYKQKKLSFAPKNLAPQTTLINASALAVLLVLLALAFKNGYITIEPVDEENPQETQDDYSI